MYRGIHTYIHPHVCKHLQSGTSHCSPIVWTVFFRDVLIGFVHKIKPGTIVPLLLKSPVWIYIYIYKRTQMPEGNNRTCSLSVTGHIGLMRSTHVLLNGCYNVESGESLTLSTSMQWTIWADFHECPKPTDIHVHWSITLYALWSGRPFLVVLTISIFKLKWRLFPADILIV